MMSNCKHNIIDNSLFSLRMRDLDKNSEKIDIAPLYCDNENCSENKLEKNSLFYMDNESQKIKKVEVPFFSILIAVYNKENELRQCMSTVLNQTCGDFEVIVVDDGSTDLSYERLLKYAKCDERVRILRKDVNESLLAARISAMKEAKGKYILFVDADDYLELDSCRLLKEKLSETPADILEFAFICEPVGKKVYYGRNDNRILIDILEGKYPHTVWNKCYSINIVEKMLDITDAFYCNMTEDAFFVPVFFALASSVVSIDIPVHHYVQENGMSNAKKISKEVMTKMIASIRTKNSHLEKVFCANFPSYAEYISGYEKKDLEYIAQKYIMKLNQPLYERLLLLNMLDEEFGTDFCNKNMLHIENNSNMYDKFMAMGRKNKIKILLKYVMRIILRKDKN